MRLVGEALHAGERVAVTLRAEPGPLRFRWPGVEATPGELRVGRSGLGVQLVYGSSGPAVDLVEHLLSAAGALGATRGLVIEPEGPELPLLDGGAAGYVEALRALGFGGGPRPELRVVRPFDFTDGSSRYELRPGEGVALEVTVDFAHPAIGRQRASWGGSVEEYEREIAPARTFGFQRDHAALRAAGRALGARPGPVLVYGEEGAVGSPPRWSDEPARHKLLDLLGDVTLGGGPVRGRIVAERPGHGPNLAMMRAARAAGALESTS